jgi:hypothetical protein
MSARPINSISISATHAMGQQWWAVSIHRGLNGLPYATSDPSCENYPHWHSKREKISPASLARCKRAQDALVRSGNG